LKLTVYTDAKTSQLTGTSLPYLVSIICMKLLFKKFMLIFVAYCKRKICLHTWKSL